MDDLSEASVNLIAVIYRKIITGYALEPADNVRAIALELDLEAAALLIGKADEIYGVTGGRRRRASLWKAPSMA